MPGVIPTLRWSSAASAASHQRHLISRRPARPADPVDSHCCRSPVQADRDGRRSPVIVGASDGDLCNSQFARRPHGVASVVPPRDQTRSSRPTSVSHPRSAVTPAVSPQAIPLAKSCQSAVLSRVSVRLVFLLLLFLLTNLSECCSSRATPRSRPVPNGITANDGTQRHLSTPRPPHTFQTEPCPEMYRQHYCLNGATCFRVNIGHSPLYNCECTDGFMGQRCEFKNLDGSYLRHMKVSVLSSSTARASTTAASMLRLRRRRVSRPLSTDSSGVDSVQQSTNVIGVAVVVIFGVLSVALLCLIKRLSRKRTRIRPDIELSVSELSSSCGSSVAEETTPGIPLGHL